MNDTMLQQFNHWYVDRTRGSFTTGFAERNPHEDGSITVKLKSCSFSDWNCSPVCSSFNVWLEFDSEHERLFVHTP